jgi:DNA-binding NtrC family response regulator
MKSTARILVATNSSLEEMIKRGSFRTDLYYRLCSHHIHLPSLSERRNDIPLLVEYFAAKAAKELVRPVPKASAETLDSLIHRDFPGNVRELKGVVMNAVAVSKPGTLVFPRSKPLTPALSPISTPANFNSLSQRFGRMPTLSEAEEFLIKEALKVSNGNQSAAAAMLGLSRQALNKRLLRDSRYFENES